MWSDEQLAEVTHAGQKAAPEGISAPALPASSLKAMMDRTAEILQARGGTMTAAEITGLLDGLVMCGHGNGSRSLRLHITAQGATVAMLMENDRKSLEQLAHALGWKDGGPGWQAAIDEVTKLRTEKIGWATELERRALSAESQLAEARATIAKLTTAGQVLSEHADRTAGEPAP